MFAPYCASCQTRRLLGTNRIVSSAWQDGGGITLRCLCGGLVDAAARPPVPSEQLRPAS